jgi:hypothetical protein
MKTKYKVFCLALTIFATVSCGTENNESENSDKDKNTSTDTDSLKSENIDVNSNEIIDDNTIVSKYNYDEDWEVIKEALLNNDLKTLNKYSLQNNVDVEELLIIVKEQFIVDVLKTTSYTDLDPVEMEDGVYLVFYADAKYEAEDGEFYESSISIYFEQGDQNLMLAYFLIAG